MVSEPVMAISSNINTNSNTITATQTPQTNFSFITPIKLDRSNYMIWRNLVLASIRANRLERYITGEKTAPNRFIASPNYAGVASGSVHQGVVSGSVNQVENPEYVTWRSQDQMLLSWLLSSISEGILSLVHSCNTSFEVWRTLEKKFGVQSEARVLQLRYEMSVLRKESLSIEEYCLKMKAIADKLACAGNPISDKDLLQQILNGLGAGYLDIATFITASKLEYDDAYALLLTHETRLEQSQNERHMLNANYAANYTNMPNNTNYGMMNAYYAQIRGNARKGGYTGGFQNNYSGCSGGRNGRGLFFNSYPRGFPTGTGHFGTHGRGQMMMMGKPAHFGKSPGIVSPGGSNLSSESQVYPQSPRQSHKGKVHRSAYMANFDPTYMNCYPPNDESWYANNFGPQMSYSGINHMYFPPGPSYITDLTSLPGAGAAYTANFEGPADDGWYLDSGTTHHLTNSMTNHCKLEG